jgi:hypothetical protein
MEAKDVREQREALLGNEGKKSYFIDLSSRTNQRLPYDASRKSFAYWYDRDEIKRIILGIRDYQRFSHFDN